MTLGWKKMEESRSILYREIPRLDETSRATIFKLRLRRNGR